MGMQGISHARPHAWCTHSAVAPQPCLLHGGGMTEAAEIVLGSLVGDALALGPHWVYDAGEISRVLGRIEGFHDPMSSYHPGKRAGDFTHYGDQTLLLLRVLAERRAFDLADYAAAWRVFWENLETVSYRDGATRETLENLRRGVAPAEAGSGSHDLGGAARSAPLFLLRWESTDALAAAGRDLAAFTHRDPAVIDAAEFFVRVAAAVREGAAIPKALEAVISGRDWSALPVGWVSAARASAASAEEDGAAMAGHGLSCAVEGAFPAVCHLLFRYPEDAEAALCANAAAGGDSAARGLVLGMVYGAAGRAMPPEWLSGLRAGDEIRWLAGESGV